MIKISAILALTLSLAFGDELPNDVKRLKSQRDQAVEKIDAKFVSQLELLKKKHMKLGDLKAANAIQDLIAGSEGLTSHFTMGEWNFSYKGMPRKFHFTKDSKFIGHFPVSGRLFQGSWKLNGKVIALTLEGESVVWGRVILSSDSTAKFSQGSYQMSGSNVITK